MLDLLNIETKNYRFERKIFIDHLSARDTETLLRMHPAMFREIYKQRRVNSIYLDSYDLQNYSANIDSISHRAKYRVRWYGETFGTAGKPSLEIKLKNNHHTGKLTYPLSDFQMDKKLTRETILQKIKESSTPDTIKSHLLNLDIQLLNTYLRKYFLSSCGNFRFTIDSGIVAYRLSPHRNKFRFKQEFPDITILELKYNLHSAEQAGEIMQSLPFRLSRNSKYVEGLKSLYTSF